MAIRNTISLGFGLIIIVGILTSPTSAGFLAELELPFTGICAAATTLATLPTCTDEFVQNINEYATQFQEVNGNRVADEVPQHVLCCAVNRLQACVVQQIGSVCGSDVEKAAKSIVQFLLKSGKYLSNQMSEDSRSQVTCDWDAWYFRKESPLCWSIFGQIAGTIGLLILLLISCCCCCCKMCCCRSKPKQIQVFIPCTTNANGFLSRNTPPYRQLNNGSDV